MCDTVQPYGAVAINDESQFNRFGACAIAVDHQIRLRLRGVSSQSRSQWNPQATGRTEVFKDVK